MSLPNRSTLSRRFVCMVAYGLPIAVTLCALMCLLGSAPAYAQYKWKDGSGQWVFSDQPPPTSAKTSQFTGPRAAQERTQVSSSASGSANSPTPSINSSKQSQQASADKDLASKRAELDTQAAAQEKQKLAKRNQQACDQTRENLAVLQSEKRVKTADANGEKSFLEVGERQQRLEQAQKDISTHCKSG